MASPDAILASLDFSGNYPIYPSQSRKLVGNFTKMRLRLLNYGGCASHANIFTLTWHLVISKMLLAGLNFVFRTGVATPPCLGYFIPKTTNGHLEKPFRICDDAVASNLT